MSKALRELEDKARKREEERRKTMLKYYEPIPEVPPLKMKKEHSSNPLLAAGYRISADLKKAFDDAIADENDAIKRYTALADILLDLGLREEEREIADIGGDEYRHQQKLINMLERFRIK